MNRATKPRQPKTLLLTILMTLVCIGIGALNSGCASSPSKSERPDFNSEHPDFNILLEDNTSHPKSIFVFLDGTANDKSSGTNVWRLFSQLKPHKNQQTVGRYIPGVGRITNPFEDDPWFEIFGDALGMGMQLRILKGYDFIAENYRPDDKIFIFGFSRGAHEARALAGLIAYAGIPTKGTTNVTINEDERLNKYEPVLKLLKDILDEEKKGEWEAWEPNQPPLLAKDIKNDKSIELDMQPAEVTFLGVWDTVPGSSFKDYNEKPCKEDIGLAKRYLHLLPLISKGERYKSDSYPPIRQIAHAVSLDEKRSRFAPLYLCKAIPSKNTENETIILEKWFPGAHADVGGGYGDNALPNISLNWMIKLLGDNYQFSSKVEEVIKNNTEDTKGLAHWSYGDEPANTGSDCEDRKDRKDRQPPLGYDPHHSIDERKQAGVVPIEINKERNDRDWKYPILCPGPGK